jgi:hypothetical protein
MFLKESEIPAGVELFAQEFSDIHRRHKRLFGRDCFAGAKPSREATVLRLRLRDSGETRPRTSSPVAPSSPLPEADSL